MSRPRANLTFINTLDAVNISTREELGHDTFTVQPRHMKILQDKVVGLLIRQQVRMLTKDRMINDCLEMNTIKEKLIENLKSHLNEAEIQQNYAAARLDSARTYSGKARGSLAAANDAFAVLESPVQSDDSDGTQTHLCGPGCTHDGHGRRCLMVPANAVKQAERRKRRRRT